MYFPTRPAAIAVLSLILLSAFNPAFGQDFSRMSLEKVIGQLANPVAAVHAPGDATRLFIVEQPGVIQIFNLATGQLNADPFLDIESEVDDLRREQGLLGLAFHPQYETNGEFFVSYIRDPGEGDDLSVIARMQVDPQNPDMALEVINDVILIPQDSTNHNGGDIKFGPDGFLYIALGDGGGSNDQFDHGQDINTLKGALLRIDVDDNGVNSEYGIAEGNPFIDEPGLDEIWAFGLRNPWRFSFDRLTGDLLIADVGQLDWEEVNFEPADSPGGINYGWSCREGANDFFLGSDCVSTFTDPVFEYDHDVGCSITGGYRYRGPVSDFDGYYFFGDFCTRKIWLASESAGNWSYVEWPNAGTGLSSIASFGEDLTGGLYLVDRDGGTIYRIMLGDELFEDSFESEP